MPVTDGFALLEHVAVAGDLARVVVLTSHEDDESRMRAYRAGALAFLAKPFDADALLAAVDRATDDRLAPGLRPRARG
jgi:DNA-binding NtrC family response regulator